MHSLLRLVKVQSRRPLASSLPLILLSIPTSSPSRNPNRLGWTIPNSRLTHALRPGKPALPLKMDGHGDVNNVHAARPAVEIRPDEAYLGRSHALAAEDDDAETRARYRPFLLPPAAAEDDWVAGLELSTALALVDREVLSRGLPRLRILVLYGSLRARSYSRLLALEGARVLHRLGCDVRVFDPAGLPLKDDVSHGHPKVQELRDLSRWSDGHFWVSAEQHGAVTGLFKTQIDWIPLSQGSVRPTQGRTLCVAQVSGGSQSFNAVNTLRLLGRWMRMFVVPNQSSVPMAYTQFTPEDEGGGGGSRMLPSSNRDRLVDCMEELVKYTVVMRPHLDLFGDRFSERKEKREKAEKAVKIAEV
ncbi:flavoprotein-like protein [Colletotrichum navitas]|uniref:Flavoprotein-like protein n=1 Tax=Colletotrichum navitas TaxID=681940 RepID=A0AAD8V632_9PEZI|nr:flavoprotein-like protein [Colletotrichum navitas]KAK1590763.1 flavoprotein-like protein [Colletotrichum navitas]